MVIVKRFRRPASRPAALPWRLSGVGPCRHGLGLAALAAKDFADIDWLVAMWAFVGCHAKTKKASETSACCSTHSSSTSWPSLWVR